MEARGSFSLIAGVPSSGGQVRDFSRGLGADSVSFAWAGIEWTAATADVTTLVFDPRGALMYWQLAGVPGGLMDMSAAIAPDVFIDPFTLLYTRRGQSRVFEGAIVWTDVKMAPYSAGGQPPPAAANPVPEPMPLALVGSGLIVVLVRAARNARRP